MFLSKHAAIIILSSILITLMALAIVGFVQMIQALQFMSKYTCRTQVKNFLIILALLNLHTNMLSSYLLFRGIRSKIKINLSWCQIIVNFFVQNKISYLYISLLIFQIIWIANCDIEIKNEPLKTTCRRPIFINAYGSNQQFSILSIIFHSSFFFSFLLFSKKNIDCRFWLKNLCFCISCSYYFKQECRIENAQQMERPQEEQNQQQLQDQQDHQQLPPNTNANVEQPIVNQSQRGSHIPAQPNLQKNQNEEQINLDLEQLLNQNNRQGK